MRLLSVHIDDKEAAPDGLLQVDKGCGGEDHQFDEPAQRLESHEYTMHPDKRRVSEDERQGADAPDGGAELDQARSRMEADAQGSAGEDRAAQEGQRAGESDGARLRSFAPDFGVIPAAVDPVAGEKPVGEGRQYTSTDHDYDEPRPVHGIVLLAWNCLTGW